MRTICRFWVVPFNSQRDNGQQRTHIYVTMTMSRKTPTQDEEEEGEDEEGKGKEKMKIQNTQMLNQLRYWYQTNERR